MGVAVCQGSLGVPAVLSACACHRHLTLATHSDGAGKVRVKLWDDELQVYVEAEMQQERRQENLRQSEVCVRRSVTARQLSPQGKLGHLASAVEMPQGGARVWLDWSVGYEEGCRQGCRSAAT